MARIYVLNFTQEGNVLLCALLPGKLTLRLYRANRIWRSTPSWVVLDELRHTVSPGVTISVQLCVLESRQTSAGPRLIRPGEERLNSPVESLVLSLLAPEFILCLNDELCHR